MDPSVGTAKIEEKEERERGDFEAIRRQARGLNSHLNASEVALTAITADGRLLTRALPTLSSYGSYQLNPLLGLFSLLLPLYSHLAPVTPHGLALRQPPERNNSVESRKCRRFVPLRNIEAKVLLCFFIFFFYWKYHLFFFLFKPKQSLSCDRCQVENTFWFISSGLLIEL